MKIHRIWIFETRIPGGKEIYNDEIVVKENDDCIRILEVAWVWVIAKRHEIDHVLFHFEDCSRFTMDDRYARCSTCFVIRKTAGEYNVSFPVIKKKNKNYFKGLYEKDIKKNSKRGGFIEI